MDYHALAELVLMGLLGLSVLIVAVGFSVRAFLAPTLREIFDRLGRDRSGERALAAPMEQLEDRLSNLERGLERLEAAERFDRQLQGPKPQDA